MLEDFTNFKAKELSYEKIEEMKKLAHVCRGDILKMTTISQSGHPGGSMSSLEIYLTLYFFANIDPKNPYNDDRDRIVISHGHTSPGVYTVLARRGFVNIDEAIAYFRKAGSIFEGHVEHCVPGVEWNTGNLGQGLSAAAGFALAGKIKNKNYKVYCVMGDGEQQKGQLSEARRFAIKYNLNNLIAIIDYNELQISGSIHKVMQHNIKADWEADDWNVIEIDGHNIAELYKTISSLQNQNKPSVIIAKTVMGKGVSFMENKEKYHGSTLSLEQYKDAMKELNLDDDLEKYIKMRKEFKPKDIHCPIFSQPEINTGNRIVYPIDKPIDNRSAWGNALKNLAELNEKGKIAVFDCDLAGSVKVDEFAKISPETFFQCGIQEHNTATISGAVSTQGILTFFADFGVFGVDETYNQHRLNDINNTNLKLICTHNGLDVGEDGKTHQCIDYIGLFRNIFGFKIIVPADGNQTDAAIRYISKTKGNFLVAMGRSKLPIIANNNNEPFYGKDYNFEYGKIDKIFDGEKIAILSNGSVLYKAVNAVKSLQTEGIRVSLYNVSSLTDISEEDMKNIANHKIIITYEDHIPFTGLGGLVALKLVEYGLQAKLIQMGVTNYAVSGNSDEVFKYMKLDTEDLINRIKSLL